MRRIGGILFLALLTVSLSSCDEKPGPVTVAVVATTRLPPVTTTSTSTTSTSTTTTSTTSTTLARVTTTVATTRLAPATTVAPVTSTGGGCDPNYAGACVPIASDVDCGGGSGNGPAYVYAKNFRVIGRDIYGLDSDGDGIACES